MLFSTDRRMNIITILYSSFDDAIIYDAITATDQRYADGRAGGSIVSRGHTGPPLGHGEFTSISGGGGR